VVAVVERKRDETVVELGDAEPAKLPPDGDPRRRGLPRHAVGEQHPLVSRRFSCNHGCIITTVVFVCHHGAAKSVIAAALLERLAAEQGRSVRALARGTEPEPEIPPEVVEGLRAAGVPIEPRRPQWPTGEELASAARVVSFGPELSGVAAEQWNDVPAVADGFAAAYDAISARLPRLLAALP
jgi:protein-tyrosine-phosphatase